MAEVIEFPCTLKEPAPDATKTKPNPDLIAQLEHMLDWAKDGTIVAGAFVLVYPDDCVGTGVVDDCSPEGGYYHWLNSGAATLAGRLAIY
jgi:hypothetical protein